jgi:hypothetical protein
MCITIAAATSNRHGFVCLGVRISASHGHELYFLFTVAKALWVQ